MPTLLAIGAHYDDCVFGVSGVLLRAVRKNYRVVVLSIIGDYTNWKPVGEARSDKLVEGAQALAKEQGVEMRFLPYASMGFGLDDEAKRQVSEVVADVRPDIALNLWPRDTHPDHEAASALGKVALRWSGTVLARDVRRPRRIYQYDNGPRHTIGFEPDAYVDVSDEWPTASNWLGRRMSIVRNESYDSSRPHPAQHSKEAIAQYRGRACGVRYAEALKSFEPYPQELL